MKVEEESEKIHTWIKHVIALIIGPVHRVQNFSTGGSARAPVGKEVARGLVVTTHGRRGGADAVGGGVLDVALEWCHVHLISS